MNGVIMATVKQVEEMDLQPLSKYSRGSTTYNRIYMRMVRGRMTAYKFLERVYFDPNELESFVELRRGRPKKDTRQI